MHTHLAILVFFIAISTTCYGQHHKPYYDCNRTYNCGSNIQNITYPFWGDGRPQFCGHQPFELKCQKGEYPTIDINNHSFRVFKINPPTHVMTIASLDLWDGYCTHNLRNFTINSDNFLYSQAVRDLVMFYGCTQNNFSRGLPDNITCVERDGAVSLGFYADEALLRAELLGNLRKYEGMSCQVRIDVPVLRVALDGLSNKSLMLQETLNQGFEVVYFAETAACSGCEESGGICGSDSSGLKFACHCRDHSNHPRQCQDRGAITNMRLLAIGASVAGMGMLLIMCIYCSRRKLWSFISIVCWKKKTKNDQNLESFIRHYKALAPKRYSYSDVKKITNSFRHKLGQGGYGGVYKGKLLDGRLVAVKILNASKGNGEDFINEVASISRTSHVNIVTFLGFCLEGDKRALIYELMPNGSLEKFIYGENPLKNGGHLGLEKLYQIAIGIARGLEYLHRGCNTRILHFDIKPHNILLDEEFCPKISDFGLAKLCTTKESIVSMVGARGTIGYIAPEVFSRNFGGVSHKSDVYSYGMMVLEMVGGRKNVNIAVDHTSEIYFPHWIYKRVEQHEEDLGLQGDMTAEEKEITRKMILVGLWCIQTDPSQRPSMSKVMEMLEGDIEGLEIPPKPYLSSPSRLPADS